MIKNEKKYDKILKGLVEYFNNISLKIKENANFLNNKQTDLEILLQDYELGYIRIFLPKQSSYMKSLKLWKEYLNDRNPNIFTQNDICNLSFDDSILSDENYWNLLQKDIFIDDVIIQFLVRNLHYYWEDLDNFDYIQKQMLSYLKKIKTEKKLVKKWQSKPSLILSITNVPLEKTLLALINHNITKISKIYNNTYYDIKQDDMLAKLIQMEHLIYIFEHSDFLSNFETNFSMFQNSDFFNYAPIRHFEKDKNRSSKVLLEKRNKALSIFIKKLDVNTSNISYYRQILIDYVINSPVYGDPRKYEWQDYKDKESISIFKRWMNEKDVKFFFETLIDDDPHGRKDFWINCAEKIDSSMFILGNDIEANIKNRSKINEFKKASVKNVVQIENANKRINTNIFILRMQNHVFIEFSEYKNACYVYDYEFFKTNIRPLFSSQSERIKLKLEDFKQRKYCLKHFDHKSNWKSEITAFIKNENL